MNITPGIREEQQKEFIMRHLKTMLDDGSLPAMVTTALSAQDRRWNQRFAALEQQAQEAADNNAARIDKYAQKAKRHGEQIRSVREQVDTDRAQHIAAVAQERKKRKQDVRQLEEQSVAAITSHTSAILDLQRREKINSAKNDKALATLAHLQEILLQDAADSKTAASDDLPHLRIE